MAKAPKERWSTDLCRVWVGKDGCASLAWVIDCHARELLGWHPSCSAKLTTAALKPARSGYRRKKPQDACADNEFNRWIGGAARCFKLRPDVTEKGSVKSVLKTLATEGKDTFSPASTLITGAAPSGPVSPVLASVRSTPRSGQAFGCASLPMPQTYRDGHHCTSSASLAAYVRHTPERAQRLALNGSPWCRKPQNR